MQTRLFKGIPTIHEVECSGETLHSDVTVFSMTLYSVEHSEVLAFVNLRDNECATSGVYSACAIDKNNYRMSRLISLLLDLKENERRTYGCNITSLRSGKAYLVSWMIEVYQNRMYYELHRKALKCMNYKLYHK